MLKSVLKLKTGHFLDKIKKSVYWRWCTNLDDNDLIELSFADENKVYYNYERPFKPNFGANLRGLLFELADDITKYEIRSQIMEAVEAYEPRVRVNQIDLQQSRTGNDMHVSLIYGIVGIQEPQQVEVILQRVR